MTCKPLERPLVWGLMWSNAAIGAVCHWWYLMSIFCHAHKVGAKRFSSIWQLAASVQHACPKGKIRQERRRELHQRNSFVGLFSAADACRRALVQPRLSPRGVQPELGKQEWRLSLWVTWWRLADSSLLRFLRSRKQPPWAHSNFAWSRFSALGVACSGVSCELAERKENDMELLKALCSWAHFSSCTAASCHLHRELRCAWTWGTTGVRWDPSPCDLPCFLLQYWKPHERKVDLRDWLLCQA